MNLIARIRPILGVLGLLGMLGLPNLAFAFHPCIDLTKEVSADGGLSWHDANTESEAVTVTSGAMYRFTVTACYTDYSYLLTDIQLSDDVLQLYQGLADKTISAESQSFSYTVDAADICKTYDGSLLNTATVTTTATDGARFEFLSASDDAWIRCEPSTNGGGEGCTPGYWKQPHHFDSWPAGITPDTPYDSIFGRVITVRTKDAGLVTGPTLLQALSAKGGNINTAARHSVAAYLNSVTTGVSYDLSSGEVISNLQSSVDNSDFGDLIEALVNFNEQGCPLN